jgi:hypothetical protein
MSTKPTREVTYCSFVTEEEDWRGVCILDGSLDRLAASEVAEHLKINPGGQVIAVPCQETAEDIPLDFFNAMWSNRNRLISCKEAQDLFY